MPLELAPGAEPRSGRDREAASAGRERETRAVGLAEADPEGETAVDVRDVPGGEPLCEAGGQVVARGAQLGASRLRDVGEVRQGVQQDELLARRAA